MKVDVKKGQTMFQINNKLETALVRAESGSLQCKGFIDSGSARAQKVVYEVT